MTWKVSFTGQTRENRRFSRHGEFACKRGRLGSSMRKMFESEEETTSAEVRCGMPKSLSDRIDVFCFPPLNSPATMMTNVASGMNAGPWQHACNAVGTARHWSRSVEKSLILTIFYYVLRPKIPVNCVTLWHILISVSRIRNGWTDAAWCPSRLIPYTGKLCVDLYIKYARTCERKNWNPAGMKRRISTEDRKNSRTCHASHVCTHSAGMHFTRWHCHHPRQRNETKQKLKPCTFWTHKIQNEKKNSKSIISNQSFASQTRSRKLTFTFHNHG